MGWEKQLVWLLNDAMEAGDDYERRNQKIVQAVALAMWARLPAGFRIDPNEPEWPVAFIELPGAGQVSWHLPQFPAEWDGHTTSEKDDRVRRFIERNA